MALVEFIDAEFKSEPADEDGDGEKDKKKKKTD